MIMFTMEGHKDVTKLYIKEESNIFKNNINLLYDFNTNDIFNEDLKFTNKFKEFINNDLKDNDIARLQKISKLIYVNLNEKYQQEYISQLYYELISNSYGNNKIFNKILNSINNTFNSDENNNNRMKYLMELFQFCGDCNIIDLDVLTNIKDIISNKNPTKDIWLFYKSYFSEKLYNFIINNINDNSVTMHCCIYIICNIDNKDIKEKSYEFINNNTNELIDICNNGKITKTTILNSILRYLFNNNMNNEIKTLKDILSKHYDPLIIDDIFIDCNPDYIIDLLEKYDNCDIINPSYKNVNFTFYSYQNNYENSHAIDIIEKKMIDESNCNEENKSIHIGDISAAIL